jgi:hypothetical protein
MGAISVSLHTEHIKQNGIIQALSGAGASLLLLRTFSSPVTFRLS